MSRSRLLFLALPALAVALVLALAPRLGGGSGVPTATVERRDFERRVSAAGNLRAVRATPLTPDPSVRSALRIAWLAPDGSRVRAGDPVVRFDPTEMEKRMEEARDELEASGLKIEKQRTEDAAEQANLGRDTRIAGLDLDTAQRFQKLDETVFARQEIIESQIDEELAAEKKEHAEHAEASHRDLAGAEEEILAVGRRRARQEIDEAATALAALEIVAPHDGLVVFQRDWRGNLPRVGDTVYGGTAVAEIPDLSEMEAEVFVLEADAGGLEAGKPATLTLEAHPGLFFEAEVARVEALAKPRLRGSPVQYFAVTLRLAETDPERMKPGQRVHSELLLERLEDVLVLPRQAVFDRDGEKVVYRRRGGDFEPVPVTLGAIGLGTVVVEEGLEEGDEVALVDPGGLLDGADGAGAGGSPLVQGLEEPRL